MTMDTTATYAVMYLEINVISVLLVLIIRIKTNGLSEMVAQRNFSNAINSQVLFFLSNTFHVVMKCGLLPFNRMLFFASKEIYFFSTALMCYYWFVYFEHMQGSSFVKYTKIVRISSVFVWGIGALLIVNIFTGIFFYVDESGVYHRGKFFVWQYILSYVYVFEAGLHAFVGMFDKSKIAKRRTLIYLALFPVVPAGAGVIQFFYPELPLACASLALATLVMYLNWTDEMISLDPLTKLNNRKQLTFYYEQWQQQEHNDPLMLMMIDADKFKQINDTYGHVQGDAALVIIANALVLACGENKDRVNIARYGGDEFTILIHTDSEETVTMLKARINEIIERLSREAAAPFELTVSIGFARAKRSVGIKDVIETADEKLYEDKQARKTAEK